MRLVAALAAALVLLALPAPAANRAERPRLLVAAGDIAGCGWSGDEATAELVGARPQAVVATLGDNVYESGTAEEFARCYEPSWGFAKSRTRPAPGNHEYHTEDAAGYFGYFGRRAGALGRGWYAYRLGSWQVIVLNSNCEHVGGCRRGSEQERWLRRTLASSRVRCTLAYWHHPRFSSGDKHGGFTGVADFWRTLYAFGADVVLSGHDHVYERFALQSPSGSPAPGRGLRQFTVGTGGAGLYGFGDVQPNSRSRLTRYGVLALTLGAGRYSWRFVDTGERVRDSGSSRCVRAR